MTRKYSKYGDNNIHPPQRRTNTSSLLPNVWTRTPNLNHHLPNHQDNYCGSHPHHSSIAAVSKWWSILLHQTIECWIHQILYGRHIYPPNSFVPHRRQQHQVPPRPTIHTTTTTTAVSSINTDDSLLMEFLLNDHENNDGSFHWNIHPQVLTYIGTALRTIVPSILSGVATEIHLNVIEYSDPLLPENDANSHPLYQILETYTFRMIRNSPTNQYPSRDIPTEVMQLVKEGMKHLIQSHIRTLECDSWTNSSATTMLSTRNDSISFQLVLYIPPTTTAATTNKDTNTILDGNRNNNEIHQALTTGTWYTISNPNNANDTTSVNATTTRWNDIRYGHTNQSSMENQQEIIDITSDNDDGDDIPHSQNHLHPTNVEPNGTTTTTTTAAKMIRPIHSYYEDQYIGIHIQCSMLYNTQK